MDSWRRCLNAAEVRDRDLRTDYVRVARFMQRREPAGYAAVRLLAPAAFQPHVLAGYAFASFTDDLCDHGTVDERRRRFDDWSTTVRAALATASAEHPLLRAFLHTAVVRELPLTWVDSYLEGARIDLDFAGFATEADYQRYVDQLTWPFLMLTSGLAEPGGGRESFAGACRLLADAGQRTDILTDLAEDLRGGRLYLPVSELQRHGVVRADLERGRDTAGVRALIEAAAGSARGTLLQADRLFDEIAEEQQRLITFVLDLHHQRLDTVLSLGPGIARGPVRDNPVACLRMLARARRGVVPEQRAGTTAERTSPSRRLS